MSRIEFLHILRGCAALLVALEHLCIVFWYNKAAVTHLTNLPAVPDTVPPPLSTRLVFSFGYGPLGFSELWNLSSFAIALFYLISGFVIPFSLRRTALPGFLAARALRLWPTYAAGLTLALLSCVLTTWICVHAGKGAASPDCVVSSLLADSASRHCVSRLRGPQSRRT